MATIQPQTQTEETRTRPTPRPAYKLTIEHAKEIATKTCVVDALLAPHDGPVVQPKNTSKR